MEFHYKFVDRFQDILKVKILYVSKIITYSNYLEPSKENVLKEYDAVTCFTWTFMIWFPKVLKLILQMQPSCPRNTSTEHWRKVPNFTAFLEIFSHLKKIDSVKHVLKVLLIVLSC